MVSLDEVAVNKEEVFVIVRDSDENILALSELCAICGVDPDTIRQLVDYDIIHPMGDLGESSETWLFNEAHLFRIRTALRLQHDLEVNLAGVALVLDLLDELEALRAHAAVLERHYHVDAK